MLDRYKAEQFVRTYKGPVLRTSSIQGHYAITYLSDSGDIVHALLREAYDRKIECVDAHGFMHGRYRSIDSILHIVAPIFFPRVEYGTLPSNHHSTTDVAPAAAYDAPPCPCNTNDP